MNRHIYRARRTLTTTSALLTHRHRYHFCIYGIQTWGKTSLSSIVFFLARLTHRNCQLLAVLTSVSFFPPFLSFLFPPFSPLFNSTPPLFPSSVHSRRLSLAIHILLCFSFDRVERTGEKERQRGASLACRLGRTRNAIRRGQPPCCRHAMPLRSSKEEGVPYRGVGAREERARELANRQHSLSPFDTSSLTYDLINFEFLIGQRGIYSYEVFLSPVFLFCLQYRVKTSIIFYAGPYP